MARTFVQPGKVLEHANASGSNISAGDVVVIGDHVGVALVDIPDGAKGTISISGVHRLPKTGGTAWSQGDKLSYDVSAGSFAKGLSAAEGDIVGCAIAAEDAAQADTAGLVLLTPGTGTVEPA